MSDNKRYVLDSNVFIQAKNQYYGFSICPGYWKSLLVAHPSKRIVSIDRVLAELEDEGDELTEWATNEAPNTFFKQTEDKKVIDVFQEMVEWVYSTPQFMPSARTEFASVADGWILAYAKANKLTLVTHEEYSPQAKRRVPMPNVCVEFNIDYVNTFSMLEDLKAKFVLKANKIGA